VLGHPWRRGARDFKRWNIACDYAINILLQDAGFKLPACALIDVRYRGKSAEWIYDRLPPEQNNGKNKDSRESFGELRDTPTNGDRPTETEWQQATRQSEVIARTQGKLPASLQRLLGPAMKPRVDWRSPLRRYVQEVTTADYSWTRPNRRYLPLGVFLPSLYSIECGRFAIGIDTSGSVDTVVFAQFSAEVQSIVDEMQPSSVDVLYCDARVNHVDSFARNEPIVFHPTGGGGTDFRPVFEKLADDPPAVLIYLTDLYGTFPDVAPDFPVVWATPTQNTPVPFGDLVVIE